MTYIPEYEAEKLYDEFLDEVNPMITICGMEYCPSKVLEDTDPIAYRCLFSDWLDGENLTTDEDEADGESEANND